ncbi:oxygen-independent coproporphyrinogen III oxidase [Modicisalibacter tunisiensis]|uniref:Coproporphyrinogen-III oxidase n=1 Tax=Modicisalibacter tunisiensis TaxID=390637 RepID=A0ABS7WXH5_9GAMM|nr:oxygen-independent coproporphyrinogen III oxidase [Modicisalibacter tunisiensis]MBZ9567327.1 oxygen-independent coproporphyrinogen III oxidase [Modicisalibacter tunisiensis]
MSAIAVDPPVATAPDTREAELIRRYAHTGPRYTSYPTALDFSPSFGAEDYTAALKRSNAARRPLSLYVHIPFCRKICFYCACNKIATKDTSLSVGYLSRLDREMVLTSRHLDTGREVRQLHWGGGTPTFLTLDQMSDLIDRLHARFGLSSASDRDYAIEIDPREANVLTLRHLQALGFNRISLGVQDLDPEVQRAINRVQPRQLTESLVEEAHRLGFRSLNLDLILGLPHQTRATFAETLDQVIAMAPARLSIFNYAHLPERFKPQRRIDAGALPPPEEKLAMLMDTRERLDAAGYVHIGLDHFARPDDSLAVAQREGRLHRNFQGYTTHGDCDLVGLGVSAISQLDDCYAQNPTRLADYEAALDDGRLATQRGLRLTFDDRLRQFVILRLMCDLSLDLDAVSEHFQVDAPTYLADALTRLETAEHDGLIRRHGNFLEVTELGRLLLRHLAMAFDTRLATNRNHYSRIL